MAIIKERDGNAEESMKKRELLNPISGNIN
jgi:hypothetical protein